MLLKSADALCRALWRAQRNPLLVVAEGTAGTALRGGAILEAIPRVGHARPMEEFVTVTAQNNAAVQLLGVAENRLNKSAAASQLSSSYMCS